jgi:hypothetical protein
MQDQYSEIISLPGTKSLLDIHYILFNGFLKTKSTKNDTLFSLIQIFNMHFNLL